MRNASAPPSSPRVALVHDFLLDVRGAERVFLEICRIWPRADIFTAVYDEAGTEGRFAESRIHTSFLQRVRPTARSFRALLPLYPAAVESFELSGYDLVISSSSAWAHGVICDPGTVHVCYCHNPFRYAWNDRQATLADRGPLARMALAGILHRWRQWDALAARRTHRYLANSETTRARIRAYFGREATVVHPPVEVERFRPGVVGEHYVIVSELMSHKQIDVAIEAFNALRRPLVIIGDGPARRRLERIAGPHVSFAGRLSDAAVAETMRSARALVVTAVEEFGIAAVEAQASGRPVIARRGGGVLETVRDGVTGRLWSGGAAELAAAVRGFADREIEPAACVAQARRFDAATFRARLLTEVEAAHRGEREPDALAPRLRPATRLARRAARDAHR